MDQYSHAPPSHYVDLGEVTKNMMAPFMDEAAKHFQFEQQAPSMNGTVSGYPVNDTEMAVVPPYPAMPLGQVIQVNRGIKEAARAKTAVIEACSRYRREEEARSMVARDCILTETNGQLATFTRGKERKTILSKIPVIYRIDADPRYGVPSYYLLVFSDPVQCCRIPVSELCKPRRLEEALAEQAPDVQFYVFGREKQLLLEAVAQRFRREAQASTYPYFFGWQKQREQFTFSLLKNTTHGVQLPAAPEDIVEDIAKEAQFQSAPNAVTIVALQQMTAAFQLVEQEDVRQLLWIWWHLSFLCSLLAQCDQPPSVGLCIRCQHQDAFRLMEAMFGWYGDEAISLGEPDTVFMEHLTDRKDQPLLIRVQSPNPSSEALLLDLVRNQKINRQALLTILATGSARIHRDPALLTLELGPVCQHSRQERRGFTACWKDYFAGFSHYVSSHLAMLLECLEDVSYPEELELSYEGEAFLRLYRGIRSFLQGYLRDLDPSQSAVKPAAALLREEDDFLISLLRHSSSSQSCDCETFLWTLQRVLASGSISLVDALKPIDSGYCWKNAPAAVFFDREHCYLNAAAFRMILSETGLPPRELTDGLKAANLLIGPFINRDSAQSRLPTKYLPDKTAVHAYKMRQEVIDDGRGAKSFFRR